MSICVLELRKLTARKRFFAHITIIIPQSAG